MSRITNNIDLKLRRSSYPDEILTLLKMAGACDPANQHFNYNVVLLLVDFVVAVVAFVVVVIFIH